MRAADASTRVYLQPESTEDVRALVSIHEALTRLTWWTEDVPPMMPDPLTTDAERALVVMT